VRYFLHSEFDQKGLPGSGQEFMDYIFLNELDALRHRCGFPLVVSSGYRTPEYNNRVSSTGLNGPHTTGKAADILVARDNAYTLLKHAFEAGCFTGIGIKQTGNDRFIHLDIIERQYKTVWSY